MDEQQMTILQRLADGADPATGEAFPADSPYQRPEIIRTLYAAIQTLSNSRPTSFATSGSTRPPSKKTAAATRSGQPWTDEEEQRLLQHFEAGDDEKSIAQQLERSKVAITARLVKLGKIDPPPGLQLRGTVSGASAR